MEGVSSAFACFVLVGMAADGALFGGVECRHPRGQVGVSMPMIEWGRWRSGAPRSAGVDFNFLN